MVIFVFVRVGLIDSSKNDVHVFDYYISNKKSLNADHHIEI